MTAFYAIWAIWAVVGVPLCWRSMRLHREEEYRLGISPLGFLWWIDGAVAVMEGVILGPLGYALHRSPEIIEHFWPPGPRKGR